MKKYKLRILDNDLSVVDRFLRARGYKDRSDFEQSLKASKENHSKIFDTKRASKQILKSIQEKQKICVYGDYDADGTIAAGILWHFLYNELKADATVYLPSRKEDGYGLNDSALSELKEKGYELIITVDCGIRDKELITTWQRKGLSFIITDHHQPPEELPECIIVHPLYPKHVSENAYTSGAFVAWKLIQELVKGAKLSSIIPNNYIDAVALSLVTDMMPLDGENRQILIEGIEKLNKNPMVGLRALIETTEMNKKPITAHQLGFVLGPRLNASGRLGSALNSARIIATNNYDKAKKFAEELNTLNYERQKLTETALIEAKTSYTVVANKIAIAYNSSWDDGIVGLVAGRLLNELDLPVIALTSKTDDGTVKGSARSVENFNITDFLGTVSHTLLKYGGHAAAAGMTLKVTVEEFKKEVLHSIQKKYKNFTPEVIRNIDLDISNDMISNDLYEIIALMEPYGIGNPIPKFILRGYVTTFNYLGATGDHLRIGIETDRGQLSLVYFNGIRQIQMIQQGKEAIFVGQLRKDSYREEERIQFFVDEIITEDQLVSDV